MDECFVIADRDRAVRRRFGNETSTRVAQREFVERDAPGRANDLDRPPSPLSNDCLAYKAVEAKLQGAVMRTNLLVNNNLDACNKAQFYVNSPVNRYAKLWHDNGIGGRAYGFGFDDTCDQSSFELIFNPTMLTITLPGDRS